MALTKDNAHRKDLTTGIADMQHRHFATIATIIREMKPDVYGPEQVAEEFADRLRFLLACGVKA